MKSEIAQKLSSLNYQFYQSFAADFSETRGRVQPGVMKILKKLTSGQSILDLGCGNGELARQLVKQEFSGTYLGTDFSEGLLKTAHQKNPASEGINFLQLDLTEPDWSGILPPGQFEVILCFAAMHHIPGRDTRVTVCKNIRRVINGNGKFYLSNWQFLKSDRLKKRILPWEKIGLSENDLDEGDYLLDWRRGGTGTRYVHHFSPAELDQLAGDAGFRVSESFDSDGKEGDLSLYHAWEPV
ncbi:MAG: class I SAM-dependent methyltransferase [Anaerolineales bacterium]|nr:MAG: class I SAM-dependent methyltransferase [Anaerolineales bacterium]